MGRKIAKLLMTHELLSKLINDSGMEFRCFNDFIIKNVTVIGIEQSVEQAMEGNCCVYIEHKDLPEKPEGCMVPFIDGLSPSL